MIRRKFSASHNAFAGSDWFKKHTTDPYVLKAQSDGYRCRSAYKLIQIQQKHNIFQPGMVVMDCGCSPGSWSQIAASYVNAGGIFEDYKPPGFLVGCDLLHVESLPGTVLLSHRDFTNEDTQEELLNVIDNRPFNVVLSDMAPNVTGSKKFDHEKIMRLAFQVRDFTLSHGAMDCSMVIKVFSGGLLEPFVANLQDKFDFVTYFKPKASRKESAELYVIAKHKIKGVSK